MPTWSIQVLSLALCLSSGFQQGYIASVLNQPYVQLQSFINESWIYRTGHPIEPATLDMMWSFLNICFPIAMIFGQFFAGYLCKKIGRKGATILANAVCIPATVLSAAAKPCFPAFELLYVARILWALACGVSNVSATVWIIECAPPDIRGTVASMQEVFMALGALVTQALGVPFSSDTLWPLIFLPNVLFALVTIIMLALLWESPQYIMQKSGNVDKARRALSSYHGVPISDSSLDAEIRICEEAVRRKGKQKEPSVTKHSMFYPPRVIGRLAVNFFLTTLVYTYGRLVGALQIGALAFTPSTLEAGAIEAKHDSMTILFMPWKARDPMSQVVRHGAWLGVMVKVAYAFTGARCLRAYSTFVLYSMGGWSHSAALFESLLLAILRFPSTLIPVILCDRLGRRPLLIWSTVACFISLVLLMISIDIGPSWKIGTLIGLSALLLISACGIGSLSRFYAAEVVPRSILLQSTSVLQMFEALTKIAVEFSFYPLANLIHGQSILLFLAPTGIFMFIMCMCPETSRRSVNEVMNDIARRKKLDISIPT